LERQDGGTKGAAISVRNLGKHFGDRVAFEDVSFEVGYGEVFGFLGPNGAGKNYNRSDARHPARAVRGLGDDRGHSAQAAERRGDPPADIGYARDPRLVLAPERGRNLECFASLYEVPVPRERIEIALRAVRLAERAQDTCGSLSKGLRQRVALARALLPDPEVLFLDEPTSGLDPVEAREVHELIDGLRQRGVTIFLTTHRLEEAERLCDRVAILNTTLRTIGRPGELRDQLFSKSLTVRTLAALPDPGSVFNGLPAVDAWHQDGASYVIAVRDPAIAAPAVTRALVNAGADVLSIAESLHSLEDVYLELIDDDAKAGPR